MITMSMLKIVVDFSREQFQDFRCQRDVDGAVLAFAGLPKRLGDPATLFSAAFSATFPAAFFFDFLDSSRYQQHHATHYLRKDCRRVKPDTTSAVAVGFVAQDVEDFRRHLISQLLHRVENALAFLGAALSAALGPAFSATLLDPLVFDLFPRGGD